MVAFLLFLQTEPHSVFMSHVFHGGLLEVSGINYTLTITPVANY